MATGPILEDAAPGVGDVARECLALLEALQEATGAEWLRRPVGRRWESERVAGASGSDPTPVIALDEGRMAVRVAVWEAWRAVHDARRRLERALGPYGVS